MTRARSALPSSFVLAAGFLATHAPCALAREPGTVTRMQVISVSRTKLSLWLRATLPAAAKGPKQAFTGELAVSNVTIPVAQPVAVLVDGSGAKPEAVFQVELELAKIPSELAQKGSTAALDVTIKGRLSGDQGSRADVFAIGVLRTGTEEIKSPGGLSAQFVSFRGAEIGGLTFSRTEAQAVLDIYSPLGFDLAVKGLTYELLVEGRRLGAGEASAMIVRGGRDNEVRIPVTVEHADLAAAAGTALTKGGTLPARMKATAILKFPSGELPVSLDLPGTLRIR